MESYRFPDGITLARYIGEVLTVNGEGYKLEDILSEKQSHDFLERWAVFEASKTNSTDSFVRMRLILKLRFQQDPFRLSPDDRESVQYSAKRDFETECKALREFSRTGVTPRFYYSDELYQDTTQPFPGGYVRVIVMSKVAGQSVVEILPRLSDGDRRTIRTQLTAILEYMRLQGYVFFEPETEQIFYDKSKKLISLVGLSRIEEETRRPEEGQPITESSVDVLAFGMGPLNGD